MNVKNLIAFFLYNKVVNSSGITMYKINDIIETTAQKLVYEGDALIKIDGFPVFIEGACPEDKLKIRITKANKNYACAVIEEILEPSPHRVKPFCPMHNVCGGCGWQHIDYDFQLEQKRNIVFETVKKITGEDIEVKPTLASPETKAFRSKVQYPVSQTKVSKRLLAGYYKKGSHELVNIKFCPIQPKIIDKITEFIRQNAQELGISGYNEKLHRGELRHIVYRMSKSQNECIIIFVVNDTKLTDKFKKLAKKVMAEFAHVKGCLINYNTQRTNLIMTGDTRKIQGENFVTEKMGDKVYKISANSFFQVNVGSAQNIFETVKAIISQNYKEPRILDAYSGVSSFGIWFADIAKEVVSVEEAPSATKDAADNVVLNNVTNLTALNGDAKKIFEQLIENGEKFDVTVLDPPRKGCEKASLDFAIKLTDKAIIYVSCNPSTLARDLKYLHENGFKTKYIQPVDMFCHSYHIESVAWLEKV